MQTLIFNSIAAWISALFQALPKKLRPSCLELLIGCIIASSGHISQALLAIDFRNHWTAYYKIFTDASWSWLRLCREWFRLTCRLSGGDKIILAVDDTLVCRSSENAPGANIHFDHAHKANRTDYPLSQLYVALFTIVRHGEKHAALPVAMQLLHKGGNRSKLEIARDLVKLADTHKNDPRPLQLLCDSWYMKEPLIAPILKKGIHCVGQLRRDSALFMPPAKKTLAADLQNMAKNSPSSGCGSFSPCKPPPCTPTAKNACSSSILSRRRSVSFEANFAALCGAAFRRTAESRHSGASTCLPTPPWAASRFFRSTPCDGPWNRLSTTSKTASALSRHGNRR